MKREKDFFECFMDVEDDYLPSFVIRLFIRTVMSWQQIELFWYESHIIAWKVYMTKRIHQRNCQSFLHQIATYISLFQYW